MYTGKAFIHDIPLPCETIDVKGKSKTKKKK